jgi:hypothetical protein
MCHVHRSVRAINARLAILVVVLGGCASFAATPAGDAGDSDAGGEAGGSDAGGADGQASDTPTVSADPGILCGAKYCKPFVEACCSDTNECVEAGAPSCADLYGCDDQADCPPTQVCCGSVGSDNRALVSTACLPRTDCKKESAPAVVCDPTASVPCPDGVACAFPDGATFAECIGVP